MRRKIAIVLFNLGGPDSPAAIKPFLQNLFSDPAILRVPFFVRFFLARIIAGTRLKPASPSGGESASRLDAHRARPSSSSALSLARVRR